MGNFVGMLARVCVAVGVMAAGVLTVVLQGGPAAAAPVPCVQTFSAPYSGPPILEFRSGHFAIPVPTTDSLPAYARVADVNVRVVLETTGMGMTVGLSRPGLTARLTNGAPAYEQFDVTFDDEASEPRPPTATSGTWRSVDPLARFDLTEAGSDVFGPWVINVVNTSSAPVMPDFAVLTITLADCDTDGDTILDRYDNCPTVANGDQTDWDGDSLGNACDATPGTAPVVPTPTPTPTLTLPPPTSIPGCTTSCAYDRAVGMKLKAERHRFVGKVVSPAVGCVADVRVTIWKKLPGRDRKLVVVTSRPTGKYATKAPRKPGRYYARVGSPEEPLCAGDKSRIVRVRRH